MSSDSFLWELISRGSCSYKVPTQIHRMCRNEYNLDGICSRASCPLANSKYATVREVEGKLYLFKKSVERAHAPKYLWEKIRLPNNLADALKVIDTKLLYWKEEIVNKNKQRYVRLMQYLARAKHLALTAIERKVPVNKYTNKVEMFREKKALKAAKIEHRIEAELLERLKQGTYGDLYNFDQQELEKVLEKEEIVDDDDDDDDMDEDQDRNRGPQDADEYTASDEDSYDSDDMDSGDNSGNDSSDGEGSEEIVALDDESGMYSDSDEGTDSGDASSGADIPVKPVRAANKPAAGKKSPWTTKPVASGRRKHLELEYEHEAEKH